ncbi:MAG TPA: hypothetical protein VGK32_16125 [Vicinamibacterales bacterium]|jgi:hypothetical protein
MPTEPVRLSVRFRRSVFTGRPRRNLVAGLVLAALALSYGVWAGARFAKRGADLTAFDQPVVQMASRLTRAPFHMRGVTPNNSTELYLVTVISDQQDVMFGMMVLVLRLIAVVTVGGLGLVLLTAGATEWEVRSEAPDPPGPAGATQSATDASRRQSGPA